MRFVVQPSELGDIIGWVSRALPAKPPLQVLSGIKMDVTDNVLRLSTFDYEQSAEGIISLAEGAEDGTAIVSGKLFSDIVKSLPRDTATVKVEGSTVRVSAGRAKFTLPMMETSEYPALPEQPPTLGEFNGKEFADAVAQVTLAAGKDDTLPVLTAVYCNVDAAAGVVTIAATDRYRLAVKKVPFVPDPGAENAVLLVPAKALNDYGRSLGSAETIKFGVNEAGFGISSPSRSGTVRFVKGEYPKWASLLPTEFPAKVNVSVKELVEAVKRVGLVAVSKGQSCRLTFEDNMISVEAGGGDEAAATETVAVDYSGDKFVIAFNFGYLLDGLGAVGTSEAMLCLTTQTRPAVIQPVSDEDLGYNYLIMPVRM